MELIMKKTMGLLLVLTILPLSVFAGVGNDDMIAKAELTLATIKRAADVGVNSSYDVLTAEKNLLELKLLKDSTDSETFAALAKNVNSRMSGAQKYYNVGVITQLDLALVQNEKEMQKKNCALLLQTTKRNYEVGMATKADIDTIAAACQSLQ
jgi:hypothetical protein